MAKVAVDRKLQEFSIASTAGPPWCPGDGAGKKLVIYFYPRDNTPGCTQEGQDFRDLTAQFRRAGALIFGVSPDSIESHQKFRAKMKFPFDLLSDESKAVALAYGAVDDLEAKTAKRISYLIGPDGKIKKAYATVKAADHPEQVLGDL